MLSKRRQLQKTACGVIPFRCNVQNRGIYRQKKWISGEGVGNNS